MSKLIERLAKKIKDDLDIEVDPEAFISIRPRKWYKLMGALSWSMKVRGSVCRYVGSIYTATECTRKNIRLFQTERSPGDWRNDVVEVIPEALQSL